MKYLYFLKFTLNSCCISSLLCLPEVAMIAKYIYEHAPLPESTKQQAEIPAMETMKYVKPDWINE